MLIKVLVVGRLKDRAIQARCDEFAKWLGPYAKLEVQELPDSIVARRWSRSPRRARSSPA